MKSFSFFAILATLVSVITLSSCTKEIEVLKEIQVPVNQNFDPTKGLLKVSIAHTVNGLPFEINKSFNDASGNTFLFNEIRYWVSNIQLTKSNGEIVKLPENYFLVENRDSLFFYGATGTATANMKLAPNKREDFTVVNVPTGDYTKIKFAIGVDSKYNNNFALSAGELNINQMSQVASWAWQTSYIFLRTKGTFLAKGGDALKDSQTFVVETGSNDLYREVEMTLPTSVKSVANQISEVKVKADVLGLFNGLSLPADFKGNKPAGWAADPNLSKYSKFINAGSLPEMKKIADNTQSSFIKMNAGN